jgi:hypothetical protein
MKVVLRAATTWYSYQNKTCSGHPLDFYLVEVGYEDRQINAHGDARNLVPILPVTESDDGMLDDQLQHPAGCSTCRPESEMMPNGKLCCQAGATSVL